MKVLGIIAEYNPFHLGHAYQIRTLKEKLHADYVIVAMSGNFVQRGAPALVDKYTRARMTLCNGADLVLELPALYATASAQYFAMGGVSLLHNTGVVTHLGFGVENDDLPLLRKAADILLEDPPLFAGQLQKELKKGLSFPAARASALEKTAACTDASLLRETLASPNNILAIEYLQALSALASPIQPVPLLRKGRGYHDREIAEGFCSASAIRSSLKKEPLQDSFRDTAMPESAFALLSGYPHAFLFEDDFSQLVHYKLLTESVETLAAYGDSSPDLANRMYHNRHAFEGWSQFCRLLKTKNTTYTRISRVLLHLVLNITTEQYDLQKTPGTVPYLRVLGFRRSAAPLLSSIKKTGNASLITSISRMDHQLPEDSRSLLQLDITASDLYHMVLTGKGSRHLLNDYRHPVVIV